MRTTPLICWHCSNWFIPKTRRPQKCCSGACRQQIYQKNKNTSYRNPVRFYCETNEEMEELKNVLSSCCKDGHQECIECAFEDDYQKYCKVVFKYGRDGLDRSALDWLKFQKEIT